MEARLPMRNKRLLALDSIFKMVILLFCVTPAFAQAPDGVILGPENPMGRLRQKQVKNMRLAEVDNPIEITNISVNGKSIIIGEAFLTPDNWIRTLTIRMKNISEQPIKSILMSISLPDVTLSNGMGRGFTLRGGTNPTGKPKVIMPREEVELEWLEAEYQMFQETNVRLNVSGNYKKAKIGMTSVIFTDGTLWGSDCLRATDPRNSCRGAA
jgi:hypothetical protein